MRNLTLASLFILACACTHTQQPVAAPPQSQGFTHTPDGQEVPPPQPVATPAPESALPMDIPSIVQRFRADVTAAFNGTPASDQVAITCHQKALVMTDRLIAGVPAVNRVGPVSTAQDIRNYTRAAVAAAPAIDDVLDACKPVYDLKAALVPLLQAVPLLAKALGGVL